MLKEMNDKGGLNVGRTPLKTLMILKFLKYTMLKELLKKHLKELLKVLDGRVNLELFVTPTNTTPPPPPSLPLTQ